jgi:hypothetical protein
LHEWARVAGTGGHLAEFLIRSGVQGPPVGISGARIYFEVALIRDAYYARKPDTGDFMDRLVNMVAQQEDIPEFRTFTQLPALLQDPSRTHPRHIRQKAIEEGVPLSEAESHLYGAIQGVFNAKPDLAIALQGTVIAYEAKFTQAFGRDQTTRTERIVEIWKALLYEDLGFSSPPNALTAAIGPERSNPDISWEWLLDMANDTYPPDDRTRLAIYSAVRLLSQSPPA